MLAVRVWHGWVVSTDDHEAHRRSWAIWLVAAAAVVIVALGVGVAGLMVWERRHRGHGGPARRDSAEQPVTGLTVPARGQAGRCLPPSVRPLRGADVAFDGVVTELEGGSALLEPSRWYAGRPSERVSVQAPSEDMQALLAAVRFEKGQRYLVAASGDGRVMLCGFSAPYSERMARLYRRAFEG